MAAAPAIDAIATDSQAVGTSPAELIAAIGTKLAAGKDSDKELVAVLQKNLLVVSPTKSAVDEALKAIEVLAEKRATEASNVKSEA